MRKQWGHMLFRCSECRTPQQIEIEDLYMAWKQKLDRKRASGLPSDPEFFVAHVRCFCGSRRTYDSSMFKYMFRLIFEEISGKNTTE